MKPKEGNYKNVRGRESKNIVMTADRLITSLSTYSSEDLI
jgi:hypothetical protein